MVNDSYLEQPFQPKPVLVDVVEVYAFYPFSVERDENMAVFLGRVGTRLQPY